MAACLRWASMLAAVALVTLLLASRAVAAPLPAALDAPVSASQVNATAALTDTWKLAPDWQVAPVLPPQVSQAVAATGGQLLLAAWQDADRYETAQVRMTVVVLPRRQLSLTGYVKGATTELATEQVNVQQAVITNTLRADGLPVAELMLGSGEQRGAQLITIDADGENLWLFTLSAPAQDFQARRQELHTLLRSAVAVSLGVP